ncbi:hypothetical protein ACOSQ4_002871 [Xanthoceras sorbifolium]
MESLSMVVSSSLPLQYHPKTHKSSISKPRSLSISTSRPLLRHSNLLQTLTKTHLSITIIDLLTSLPCLASETVLSSTEPVANKIDFDSIGNSIYDFINRYPFFVSGCAFIWIVVIPVIEYHLSKCKYIYAIWAFEKLRDDPNAQLLDIRNAKTMVSLGSPNLQSLNKKVVQVQFTKKDKKGFVKNVLNNFADPANTVLCILDNFDGYSLEAAELLFKKGFKEAYAIKYGVRGKKGWLAIQRKVMPPALHILPKTIKKKVKTSQQLEINGVDQQTGDKNGSLSSGNVSVLQNQTKDLANVNETENINVGSRSSSPYPNYPDMKPPSSPTPSKP